MIRLGIILIIGKCSIMLPGAASLHSLAVEEVIKVAYLFGSIGISRIGKFLFKIGLLNWSRGTEQQIFQKTLDISERVISRTT